MPYVIVQLKINLESRTAPAMIGNVTGPFPNAAAALAVATSMGGAAMGYYVRPIHEPGDRP